jgi:electron transport complex protein RnfD
MGHTLLALVPGVLATSWVYGMGIWLQLLLAVTFALALEAALLKLRGRPVKTHLLDGSAALTAVLFVLCLPPTMPWWSALVGMLFAIGIAKQLYGGLGQNVFNPAMVGYVVVLLAFPLLLSQWPASQADWQPGEWLQTLLAGPSGLGEQRWDALSGPTLLTQTRELHQQALLWPEIEQQLQLSWPSRGEQSLIALAYLLGGVYLLANRIISFHAPLGVVLGVLGTGGIFWLLDPSVNPGPLFHLFSGGLMLGAFFIVTDPVSGANTPRGRILFGIGVAILTLAIRRWGGYPDAVAFAVLLMNMLVPLLDRFTRPRVYGHV